MQKRLVRIYSIIFAAGFAYLIFVRITGIKLPCIFYETTGLLCPGCGITRMFVQLSCFNIKKAFMYNPVCFVSVAFWLTFSVLLFIGKPKYFRNAKLLYIFMYINFAALILFGLLRNFIVI